MKEFEYLLPFHEISAAEYDEQRPYRLHRLEIIAKVILDLSVCNPDTTSKLQYFVRGLVYVDEVEECVIDNEPYTNVLIVLKDSQSKPHDASLYIAANNLVVVKGDEYPDSELGYFGATTNSAHIDVLWQRSEKEQQLLAA